MVEYTAGPTPALEDIGIRLNGPIPPGPPDLFNGLLPMAGELVIAGETNVGKSLVALEIMSSACSGKPLWGDLYPTKAIKKALYVLGEHYVEVIQRLLQVTKLEMPDTAFILGPEQLSYDKWLVTRGQPNLAAVSKFQKWAEGCDLIVFDPFSSFVCGQDVENDNITMRLVLDTMSLIAQSAGASCLILAHQGKPMMNQFGQETKRKSYAIRGASAVEDAATNIFYMDHASGGNEAIEQETGGKVYELVQRKYKGQAPPSYKLLRDKNALTHTLMTGNAFETTRKIDLKGKIQRMQDANPRMEREVIIGLLASSEGKSKETLKRWLGELID